MFKDINVNVQRVPLKYVDSIVFIQQLEPNVYVTM